MWTFFQSTPSVFVFCLFLRCSSYKNEIDDMEKFCFCKNCISLWACKEESTASLPLNGQIKSFIQWKFYRKLVPVDSFKDLSLWLIRKFFRPHFSTFLSLFVCFAFSLNNFQVFFVSFSCCAWFEWRKAHHNKNDPSTVIFPSQMHYV